MWLKTDITGWIRDKGGALDQLRRERRITRSSGGKKKKEKI